MSDYRFGVSPVNYPDPDPFYCIVVYCILPCHDVMRRVLPVRVVTLLVVSRCHLLYFIAFNRTLSYRVILHWIVSYRIMSCHAVSCRVKNENTKIPKNAEKC